MRDQFWWMVVSVAVLQTLALPDLVSKTIGEHSVHPATVTTTSGDVKGSLLRTRHGKTIYTFRGVRFAKPPVNELRFQPPQPAEKWEGVYDATEDGASCPQYAPRSTASFSEDCLFVNIYTTKLPKGHDHPKRPVMVYFHAGGFYAVTGASYLAGPKYLLDQDIVLVVPNYRLGTLGFLSTGTKEAPGNNGLKDQVLVLQWIKNNIAAFGGNPECVTIFGYSAGSVSVMAHLISPMSKGLFHRAIAMSGSLYATWPIPSDQLDVAKRQAQLVNCPDGNIEEMVECLKGKPALELGNSMPGFAEFGNEPILIWRPVVEPDFGQVRFLEEQPMQSVRKGKMQDVPVVTGVTADEFAGSALPIVADADLLREFDEDFEKVAPIALLYERGTANSRRISKALRRFYFGDRRIDNSTLDGLEKLYADGVSGFGGNKGAKILASKNHSPVYYYCFNYTGRYSHIYLPGTNNTVPHGVAHHDDLMYLFNSVIFPFFNNSDPESRVVDKLTTMWTNFAKTGKPVPEPNAQLDGAEWKPFSLNHQVYLDIGEKLVSREKLYEERYSVWEKLFPLQL